MQTRHDRKFNYFDVWITVLWRLPHGKTRPMLTHVRHTTYSYFVRNGSMLNAYPTATRSIRKTQCFPTSKWWSNGEYLHGFCWYTWKLPEQIKAYSPNKCCANRGAATTQLPLRDRVNGYNGHKIVYLQNCSCCLFDGASKFAKNDAFITFDRIDTFIYLWWQTQKVRTLEKKTTAWIDAERRFSIFDVFRSGYFFAIIWCRLTMKTEDVQKDPHLVWKKWIAFPSIDSCQ